MTSLSEVYEEGGRSTSLRQLYLGVGLFVAGVALVVAGILTAGTGLVTSMGYSLGDARLFGGVFGGLGVPLVMLGVMSVLPASRNTRAAAIVGASIMALGVALFAHAYPCQWIGNTCSVQATDLTLPTAGIYFLGAATSFWCLFVGVANFKTRNDPGGTVTMEVTHKGETKVVEVDKGRLGGLGGMGFLGGTPDGDVETQTNAPGKSAGGSGGTGRSRTASDAGRSPRTGAGVGGASASASDGGASGTDISSPLDDQTTDSRSGVDSVDDGRSREWVSNREGTSTDRTGSGSTSRDASTGNASSRGAIGGTSGSDAGATDSPDTIDTTSTGTGSLPNPDYSADTTTSERGPRASEVEDYSPSADSSPDRSRTRTDDASADDDEDVEFIN